MKDIIKIMEEYGQAFEQINGTYLQAKKFCDDNYVKTSSMYDSTIRTALDTRTRALKPLMDKSKGAITERLTGARKQIQKVILTQPSEEQMKLIQMVQTGTFTDTEKAMFLDSVKGNYLANKLMHQAMGIDFSSYAIENILDALDKVEEITSQHFEYDGTPSNSYNSRMLMHPTGYLNQIEGEINEFLTAYSQDSVE